jgi:hypothetical protein
MADDRILRCSIILKRVETAGGRAQTQRGQSKHLVGNLNGGNDAIRHSIVVSEHRFDSKWLNGASNRWVGSLSLLYHTFRIRSWFASLADLYQFAKGLVDIGVLLCWRLKIFHFELLGEGVGLRSSHLTFSLEITFGPNQNLPHEKQNKTLSWHKASVLREFAYSPLDEILILQKFEPRLTVAKRVSLRYWKTDNKIFRFRRLQQPHHTKEQILESAASQSRFDRDTCPFSAVHCIIFASHVVIKNFNIVSYTINFGLKITSGGEDTERIVRKKQLLHFWALSPWIKPNVSMRTFWRKDSSSVGSTSAGKVEST